MNTLDLPTVPARGGDESATFSADSSELLNTPSGDAERVSESDLTGTGRPQDVEAPSIYSGEPEGQEGDSIAPEDSASQVSDHSRGADEKQSLISSRSSEVRRASEAIKRRKLRIAESTADVEREEVRLASMQKEADNRSNLSTRSRTSRTTQRKLIKAFSESAPLAPRASTPPLPRASGEKSKAPPSPCTPGADRQSEYKKPRDLPLDEMYESNWSKVGPADVPQFHAVATIHTTPDIANTTASGQYGPVKHPAKNAGITPLLTGPYKSAHAFCGDVDDLIDSAQCVSTRKGLDAELGVSTVVENDVIMVCPHGVDQPTRDTLVNYINNYQWRGHEEWKRIETAFNQVIASQQHVLRNWTDQARNVMQERENIIVATYVQRENEMREQMLSRFQASDSALAGSLKAEQDAQKQAMLEKQMSSEREHQFQLALAVWFSQTLFRSPC